MSCLNRLKFIAEAEGLDLSNEVRPPFLNLTLLPLQHELESNLEWENSFDVDFAKGYSNIVW